MNNVKTMLSIALLATLLIFPLACNKKQTPEKTNKPTAEAKPSIKARAGGNLECYSDNKCSNNIWTGNSAHNCCSKGKGGKSWTCPSYNNGKCVKCSANKSRHCP